MTPGLGLCGNAGCLFFAETPPFHTTLEGPAHGGTTLQRKKLYLQHLLRRRTSLTKETLLREAHYGAVTPLSVQKLYLEEPTASRNHTLNTKSLGRPIAALNPALSTKTLLGRPTTTRNPTLSTESLLGRAHSGAQPHSKYRKFTWEGPQWRTTPL